MKSIYELHQLIDQLYEEDAEYILSLVKETLRAYEDDTLLTPAELYHVKQGKDEIERGEYITLDDYLAQSEFNK